MKLDTEKFVERARLVHGDRYDYSHVVYKRSTEKVQIVCPEHGLFLQAPENHVNQQQHCPSCANINKGRKHSRKNAYIPALLYVAIVDDHVEVGMKTSSALSCKGQLLRLHFMSLKDVHLLLDQIQKSLGDFRHSTYEIYAAKTQRYNNENRVFEILDEILPKILYPYK